MAALKFPRRFPFQVLSQPVGTMCVSALLLPQFPLPVTSPKLQQLAKAASELGSAWPQGTEAATRISSFFVVIFLEMSP